jgi:orotate phosphoribosyltransferase
MFVVVSSCYYYCYYYCNRIDTTSGTFPTPKFDVIFGPAYKGIPLGSIVCMALYSQYGINVGYSYNRKEAKDHGEGGVLVGAPLEGKRVLIIDDVITAGTAIREVYTLLVKAKAIPVGVVIAIDRDEIYAVDDPVSAVQAVSRDMNLTVLSIISLKEIQMYLEEKQHVNDGSIDPTILPRMLEYRKQYGSVHP